MKAIRCNSSNTFFIVIFRPRQYPLHGVDNSALFDELACRVLNVMIDDRIYYYIIAINTGRLEKKSIRIDFGVDSDRAGFINGEHSSSNIVIHQPETLLPDAVLDINVAGDTNEEEIN